jgi:AcrR family transcriptional regulator
MRRLAERLGIRAPSLYKHLPDKAALEAAIIATGFEDAAAFEGGGRRRGRAVFAFAHGMVMLELTGRIPPDDPDHAWQEGISAFQARVRTAERTS